MDYQGTPLEDSDCLAMKKLEQLIGAEMPLVPYVNQTIFGFTTQQNRVSQLGLSQYDLAEFPQSITQLDALVELFLRSNKIVAIPPEIQQLTSLRFLEIESNHLITLPETCPVCI